MTEIHELTAVELRGALAHGEVTPTEVTEHFLGRIGRLNGALGAFVTVTAERAAERARHVSAEVPRTAPIWGLPYGDKDLWMRAGVHTGFGSRLMAEFIPDTTDDVLLALDDAGGVSLGKTAAPEFGLPAYTEPLATGPARNPWDTRLGSGGSSGGAAVAVAAGMLPFAPGSDGGGSIRIPAAACGVVGLKPGRGTVPSGSGIDALAGLVVNGPIARTVADAALLLDGMIDRVDGRVNHRFALRPPAQPESFLEAVEHPDGVFRLAVMSTSAWDDAYDIRISAEARAALDRAVVELTALGHGIEVIELEPDPGFPEAFRTVWKSGASAIPVDGEALDLLEPLTRWLVTGGRELPARALAEALAALSGFERSLIRQFAPFDAVLTPALALTPRPLGWFDPEDGERNFAQQVQYTPFTSMINVSGLPAISLPVDLTADGLPMGVQAIGRPGGEATLFALGAQLERVIGWRDRRPPCWDPAPPVGA